jgi:hypothetical protein
MASRADVEMERTELPDIITDDPAPEQAAAIGRAEP